jgi:hypothetical protein
LQNNAPILRPGSSKWIRTGMFTLHVTLIWSCLPSCGCLATRLRYTYIAFARLPVN